jgi:uncharacterized membrane-anchored protein
MAEKKAQTVKVWSEDQGQEEKDAYEYERGDTDYAIEQYLGDEGLWSNLCEDQDDSNTIDVMVKVGSKKAKRYSVSYERTVNIDIEEQEDDE